ncbi:hypothetical protein A8C32_16895 [Flavivirga aquatica]|uniref:histidine kinase n=1 Tax=Flavivirga aquatica TaxID=1849968 RepID=A0A1E5T8M2_9FLAO|nr:hybrid sensor histidine kinase/response regulator transcription factor [Flavivirga aquatica]OEK07657.1 hypothetical protein A8C32_16895 [Flavivirga aquatica]
MLKKSIIILFLFLFQFSIAQEETLKYFKKFTISDGLAHNGVTSMHEDSRGFLWFGTYDGINKYDGYEFKTYKNTIDKNILTSNRVRALNETDHGDLWIGTDHGVTVYNFISEKFTKIYSNEIEGKGHNGPIIRKIIVDKNSDLIFCATQDEGVLAFKKDYTFLGKYLPSKEDFPNKIIFFNGLQLDKTHYIFATSTGLLLFNSNKKEFQEVLKGKINYATSIIGIKDNTLLVSPWKGVTSIEYKIENDTYSFHVKERILESYIFNSLIVDALGNLWLGELNEGIIKVENIDKVKNKEPFKLKFFKDNLGVLRSSSFITSSNNNCWFASFNEGVYKFDINKNPFKSYSYKMNYDYGLRSNSVAHITPLDNQRAYISATLGGLALFNTETNKFEQLPFKLPAWTDLKEGAVFVDSRKNTWIYVDGISLIYRIKYGDDKLEEVALKNLLNPNTRGLRSFTEDKYGNIWIGAFNEVYKVSLSKLNDIENVELLNDNPYFKDNKIALARRIYADPIYDFIWIGVDSDGLFRVSNKKNTPIEDLEIKQFVNNKKDKHSISSNFVSAIVRLPNEDLWVGTEGGGICKVINSNSKPKFIALTEKNGLSNNVIKNILYDSEYNLWIPTNIGLNKLNTKDNSFRKFNESDGLPFEDFWFAAKRLNNGIMILSGLDGFCYFDPKEVTNSEKLPQLQFENFKIFDKLITPGDTINNRVLFKDNLTQLDEIKLKHNENVFSLDLTSLHFSNNKNHFIKYKLTPINQDWVEAPSNQKTIHYNGLQPGEYELSVMASNSINEWTSPKRLNIIIEPSVWNTNLAYSIYVLLTVILIYMVIRVILKIQTLNHKVEIEQLEINAVKEVNEAKLRFFSNISHEIKTPLTLISGPINILLERFKGNADIGEKLNLMQRQSKKIQQLVDQVHDFRRADANALKMNYSRFSFNTFIEELTEDFKFFAKNDKKNLEIEREKSTIIVSADKDKLEKIFNNLLNNAFKYTQTNDTIKIKYKSDDKDVIVSVIDTGRGIDNIDLAHIFERFYQSHKKENAHMSGSGIGLAFSKRLVEMHYGFIDAQSELDVGTTITVRLPIVKEHLAEEKIEEIVLPEEKEIIIDNHFFKDISPSSIEVTGEFSESLVFYAEDNTEMRNYVFDMLSKFFKVKSFRNGKECFEAMADEWPDIVISDVQMPELNGLDLCIRIKSDLKTSHIPVILLTALANIEDHLQGIRDGADAYINKPFYVQRLVANIEALLINRKQLRERYQVGIPLTKENNKNNRNDNAFLDKLYSLMEENIDNQDFDLNYLAKELYLNRTHFYQKVKVLTNQTPFELLKMYRLKKAAELLVQKELSVNEVFVMTGFKSRTHFAKVFKEKYDVSPGKYAAEIKKKYTT